MSASSAIVKVTPIIGCRQEGKRPTCHLLEIDEARILLDCGTRSDFNIDHLSNLKRLAKSRTGADSIELDLILISQGDIGHLGGIPNLLASMATPCPVLATLPVHHLGIVTLYDYFEGYFEAHGSAPPTITLDQIDTAFEKMTLLRYAQPYTCAPGSGRAAGITVTPLSGGRSLGGTMWRIRRHAEEIVYAVDFSHRRETVVEGASLDALPQRPALLIGEAKGALEVSISRKDRDEALCSLVNKTFRSGGSVLIPVDTAGRTLEIIQVLERHWQLNRDETLVNKQSPGALLSETSTPSAKDEDERQIPLLIISHQSHRVLTLARGMLEWMSSEMGKTFEKDRSNPFDLRAFTSLHNLEEARDILASGPAIILATNETLTGGPALGLLAEYFIEDPKSVILLTSLLHEEDSLANQLLKCTRNSSKIKVVRWERKLLHGAELKKYLEMQQEDSERRAAEMAFAKMQRSMQEEDDAFSDGEDDANVAAVEQRRIMEQEEQALISSVAILKHVYWTDYRNDWNVEESPSFSEFYPLPDPDTKNAISSDVPFRYQVFPLSRAAKRIPPVDEYGESISEDISQNPQDSSLPGSLLFSDKKDETDKKLTNALQAIAPMPQEETKSESQTAPSKWVRIESDLLVKCSISSISFDGLPDGRSLKTIYARLQPRRLLLVGASDTETDFLYNHFHLSSTGGGGASIEVFAPPLMVTVAVSSALNVQPTVFSDALLSRIRLHPLEDYEVAWVRGVLRPRTSAHKSIASQEDTAVSGKNSIKNFIAIFVSSEAQYIWI